MNRESLALSVAALRVFPLPGTVLLPGATLPLHVFEPRYRILIADALAGDGLVCVPQIVEGQESEHLGSPLLYPYAAVGRITSHQLLPDGRYNILLEPVARVRLVHELESATPYRVFSAELMEEHEDDSVALAAVGRRVLGLVSPILAAQGSRGGALMRGLQTMSAEKVAAALAPLIVEGTLPRQAYLAEGGALHRAELVEVALLTRLAESRVVVAEA